jgi:hypothetical protein
METDDRPVRENLSQRTRLGRSRSSRDPLSGDLCRVDPAVLLRTALAISAEGSSSRCSSGGSQGAESFLRLAPDWTPTLPSRAPPFSLTDIVAPDR